MSGRDILCKVFPGHREALCALYDSAGSLAELLNMTETQLVAAGAPAELAEKLACLADLSREYFISAAGEKPVIVTEEDAADFFRPYFTGRTSEVFAVAYMNGRGEVLHVGTTEGGTRTEVRFNPTACVREAVRRRASAVCLAHNHPDGFAVPSKQDFEMTRDLAYLLRDLNIAVFEHVIFAGDDYCFLGSFRS